VHDVAKGKNPRDGATEPKCVDKKTHLQILWSYNGMVKWSLHKFLVSISMIVNGLFEVTFSSKEGEKHTLHYVFKMQNKQVFSLLGPWFFKFWKRLIGPIQNFHLGLILNSPSILAQLILSQPFG
jgi:hypothetical protein